MPLTPPSSPLHGRDRAIAVEVYDYLGRALISGELAPGERLRDVEIAEVLGVSRTPVREAILWFVQQGVIEAVPNRYTRIAHVTPERRESCIAYMGYVCGNGIHLALRRGDPAVRTRLADAVDVLLPLAGGTPIDTHVAIGEFYRRVVGESGNSSYSFAMGATHLPVQLAMGGFVPYADDADARIESFRALRRAIETDDAELAERIVRAQHGIE